MTASTIPTRDELLADSLISYFEQEYPGTVPPNHALRHVTLSYLDSLDPEDPPSPSQVEQRLLALVNDVFSRDNAKRQKSNQLTLLRRLTPYQTAQCLLRLHHVIRIAPNARDTDREYDLLAMFCSQGSAAGCYTPSEDDIRTAARLYDAQLTINDFKEILAILREGSRRTSVCQNRDLIAVENGIFNYSRNPLDVLVDGRRFHFPAKALHPFDPAFVFLTKSHVELDLNATSPVFTHPVDGDWEVEEWMNTLSDDPEIVNLLWEILGAIIRPHVSWGKAAWFYSERGNNGKGSLCELARNLTGPGAYTSIPISEFGKDFALEPLVRASAIITDENDVGIFIDRAANLKAIVTNDVIQINRKYRMPIAYQFWGFMVQCLNEFPRFKDKSESFYRRQLFVPFEKWFGGNERKYIKSDYLRRPELLRYVLKRVLVDSSYYQLSEPPATKAVLAEYKSFNDPVRGFWEEFRDRFAWDLLPFGFCYELYRAWFSLTSPSGSPVSRNAFISDLYAIVQDDDEWFCDDKKKAVRPGMRMSAPEPLIVEFDLRNWMNPDFKGSDPLKRSMPVLSASYRGLQRISMSLGLPPAPDDFDAEPDELDERSQP